MNISNLLKFVNFGKKKLRRPKPTEVEKNFSQADILVSKTDTKGIITYANAQFIDIAGYSQEELLGEPHSLTRHPKMPKVIFKLLWQELKAGKEINAYVVNLSKDGSYYWVFANVTPSFDASNNIIGFHSTRRRPSRKALQFIQPLYSKLRQHEVVGGVEESGKILEELLNQKGVNYDELIFNLQYS
jgi:PAS domain S-box-containing protein